MTNQIVTIKNYKPPPVIGINDRPIMAGGDAVLNSNDSYNMGSRFKSQSHASTPHQNPNKYT